MKKKGFATGLKEAWKSPQAGAFIMSTYTLSLIQLGKYYEATQPKEPEMPEIVAKVNTESKQLDNILLYHLDTNADSLMSKISNTLTSQEYKEAIQTYSEHKIEYQNKYNEFSENMMVGVYGTLLASLLLIVSVKKRMNAYFEKFIK